MDALDDDLVGRAQADLVGLDLDAARAPPATPPTGRGRSCRCRRSRARSASASRRGRAPRRGAARRRRRSRCVAGTDAKRSRSSSSAGSRSTSASPPNATTAAWSPSGRSSSASRTKARADLAAGRSDRVGQVDHEDGGQPVDRPARARGRPAASTSDDRMTERRMSDARRRPLDRWWRAAKAEAERDGQQQQARRSAARARPTLNGRFMPRLPRRSAARGAGPSRGCRPDPARSVALVDQPLDDQEEQDQGDEQRPELVARRARARPGSDGLVRAQGGDARAVARADVRLLGAEQVDREEQRLVARSGSWRGARVGRGGRRRRWPSASRWRAG